MTKKKSKKEEKPPLAIADRTMMGIINFSGKKAVPFVSVHWNVSVQKREGKCVFRLGANIEGIEEYFKLVPKNKKLWKNVKACFDYTNDPTNEIAGLVVSLGYWSLRFQILNGELTSLNPLTIICKEDDLVTRFTRPQRPLYESQEELLLGSLAEPLKQYVLGNVKNVGRVILDEQKK